VVIVPFLYSLDDATFDPVDVEGEHFFEVRHICDEPRELERRIHAAVDAARRSRARIAIFPELALNEHLLEVLKASLKRTFVYPSSLDWVIVGTAVPVAGEAPYQTANMAVVLNSIGEVIEGQTPDGGPVCWEQRKRHRYTMSAEEQQHYGLVTCFGPVGDECNREEAIAVGRQGFVFADPSGGFAVLICEDWNRETDTCAALRQIQPRVVFAIVMDGPMMEDRWAAKRALDIVEQTDAFVVIANSLLLPNRPTIREYYAKKHGVADPYPGGQQWVGLLYGPSSAVPKHDPFPHRFHARAMPDPDDASSLISNEVAIPLRTR
jgi:predicted amidohydrolase